ncbi:hypothetical protein [Vibrio sp. bablab_jr001]|uniref:hypothetical protein n=1 Tax=Vibrio sp. bablab_jr001 TaxID=2755067 RepID=UPI0018F1A5D6|nr:hypothetical protein [Vibrio sp. bablab_jr001]
MANFLTFKSLNTEEPITINANHIVSVEPADDGECIVRLSSDKVITIEAEFDKLAITLEGL